MAASNTIRYFLFAFNFLCWIAGLGMFAIGIWLRVDPALSPVVTLELGWFYTAVYVIIIVGVVTIAIGFLGCCGAMRESPALLKIYVCLLALMFILEVIAGILGWVWRNELDQWVRNSFSRTFNGRYIDDFSDSFQDAVVYFQRRMDCCGLNTPEDWENWQEVDSCPCPIDRYVNQYDWTEKCQEDRNDYTLSVYKSCWDNISLWLKNHIIVIGIIGFAVGAVQCLGIYCGIKMIRQFDKGGEDGFLSIIKSPIKAKKAKKEVPLETVTTAKDEGESLVKEKDQPPPKEPEVEAAVTTKEPTAPADETEPLSPPSPAEEAEPPAKENEA